MTTVVDKWPPTTEPGLQAHLAPSSLFSADAAVPPATICEVLGFSPIRASKNAESQGLFEVLGQMFYALARRTWFCIKDFAHYQGKRGESAPSRYFPPKRIKVVAQNRGVGPGQETRAAIPGAAGREEPPVGTKKAPGRDELPPISWTWK